MQNLIQDLRYGIRTLRTQPAFALIAVLTLAVGIGANSAVFSLINSLLLSPLPYPDAERLVMVWEKKEGWSTPPVMYASPPNFHDWRANNQVFDELAAYRPQGFNLAGDGNDPERVQGARVSANLLAMLKVNPARGRAFRPEDDLPNSPGVALISHALWQSRFGSSPDILEKNLNLDGRLYTVIGVMPPQFDFPPSFTIEGFSSSTRADLWVPYQLDYAAGQRRAHFMFTVGRLKDGVSTAQAQADLQAIAASLAERYPDSNSGWGVAMIPLHQQVFGDLTAPLLLLLGTVALVLLIACANIANLLLARATTRQREISIRAALGASRLRLLRQLFVESLILSLLGGAGGLVLAAWGSGLIVALAPQTIYRLDAVGVDAAVVAFTSGVSLLTALIFGVVPALQHSQVRLVDALKEGSATASAGGRKQGVRNAFVVAEIALSVCLLIGAGLLVKSFNQLQNVPLGFQSDHLTALTINLPRSKYAENEPRIRFFDELRQSLKNSPGIEAVTFSDSLPLSSNRQGTSFQIEGEPAPPPGQEHNANISAVAPHHFAAMGIPLLQGREFNEQDRAGSTQVVIVSETLAKQFFGGDSPVGKRLSHGFRDQVVNEIVGVVADERFTALQDEFRPNIYLPYAQVPLALPITLLVRSPQETTAVVAAVRAAVTELDATLPVYDAKGMDQVLSAAVSQPRFMTTLLLVFAGVALVLAAIGIYGVMSYVVAQSTRDIGIRLAIGAQSADIFKLVVGRGLRLTAAGLAIGVGASIALTRLISSLLFNVSPTDPLTFAAVSLLIGFVALLACFLPARRAAGVDPIVALKYE